MDSKSSSVLLERYEVGRLLGQGAFAKVYYGRSIKTGQCVAIKVIDKEKILSVRLMNQIKREIHVLRLVKHPNIVQLYEVMATRTKIYFVMEYAKGGELFNKVAKGKLKEDAARKYFQQLINAVDFCHSRGVCHRDLKPENLLLDEDENLKISDFGLSALAESKRQDGLLHTTCGTPAYVAPEVINRKGYEGATADVWSCGVILFVLLAGYLPFHDSNLMEMYRKIGKAEFKCPRWFSKEVRKLLATMLDPNPNSRISISKIKENLWLKRDVISKSKECNAEIQEVTSTKSADDASSNPCDICSSTTEDKPDLVMVRNLNAFNIISFSPGLDLTRIFEERSMKREARFTSSQPVSIIISKLEDIAKRLKMKVRKKDAGLLTFEGVEEGRKGILSIDAEIFEMTPATHLVEVKKTSGDTMEYQKILDDDLRPGLQDVVWDWHRENQEQSRLRQPGQETQNQLLSHQQQLHSQNQQPEVPDEQQKLLLPG